MKVLHIGSGVRPFRRGGLVAYIEDLLEAQAARGHDLTYLYAGRYFPFVPRPLVRPHRRGGIAFREILSSPLFDHGRQPELEIAEPGIEAVVARTIRRVRPDVVHVHELAGLPSSVLSIAHERGVPTVFTLQDYYALCPTFKLLDHECRTCIRRQVGADCVATTALDRRPAGLLFEATLRHHAEQVPYLGHRPGYRHRVEWRARSLARRAASASQTNPADAAAYQRRREVNVDRLNGVDRLVAMSERVAELYRMHGVDASRIRTMQLTLEHIEHLTPRRATTRTPLTFVTLGALESVAKGGTLLLDAVRRLERVAPAGSFRVVVLGHVDWELLEDADALPSLDIRRAYRAEELDALLDEVDVGLMPSIWEEAYGYAGVEMLAKGIPVIGNAVGGIVDYVRDGETGWLNRSRSAEELARIMLDVIERPEQVAALNETIIRDRARLVLPLSRHVDEIDALYRELV